MNKLMTTAAATAAEAIITFCVPFLHTKSKIYVQNCMQEHLQRKNKIK